MCVMKQNFTNILPKKFFGVQQAVGKRWHPMPKIFYHNFYQKSHFHQILMRKSHLVSAGKLYNVVLTISSTLRRILQNQKTYRLWSVSTSSKLSLILATVYHFSANYAHTGNIITMWHIVCMAANAICYSIFFQTLPCLSIGLAISCFCKRLTMPYGENSSKNVLKTVVKKSVSPPPNTLLQKSITTVIMYNN